MPSRAGQSPAERFFRMRVEVSFKVYPYNGRWVCRFLVDGRPDYDERGTYGLGVKLYDTKEKATAAGKRYVKKMLKLGFSA